MMWVSLGRTFTFDLVPDQHTVRFYVGLKERKKLLKS